MSLGAETVVVGDESREVEFSARLFDFGVISLRARLAARPDLAWSEFAAFGAVSAAPGWAAAFARVRERLLARVAEARRDAGDRHRPAHRLREPAHAAGTLRGAGRVPGSNA